MGHIQINVIFTSEFHLVIDRTCHDVTRGERQTFVVFLHKFFSVQRTQDTAIPSHRFGDQEARAVSRMEEGGRVELDALHVADSSFRAIHHCDTVTRSDQRVGRVAVDSFATSCCHNCHFGQERVYLAGVFVQHISAIAFDTRRMTGDDDAQVMLRDDLYRKVMVEYRDVGMSLDRFDKA